MARTNGAEHTVKVAKVPKRAGVSTGKPNRIVTAAMRMKWGSCGAGYGSGGGAGAGVQMGSGGNFYSPELSTDFLELPQSLDELRNFYRFFYENEPFVAQAIDLHGELPLSKIRFQMPKAKSRALAERSMRFTERWSEEVELLEHLIGVVHELTLIGEVFIFAEDPSPEMPEDVTHTPYREVTEEGEIIEEWHEREDADERAVQWLSKNYKGWSALRVLPPEQIHMETFPFTDEAMIEVVPDSKSRDLLEKANQGDHNARRIVDKMPVEIVNALRMGENLSLNTDPDAGSFCHYMARKKSPYEPRGKSLLQRCLLPGTSVWVKREGVVQPVAAEEVTTDDLALTHKGRFQPITGAGSRQVAEEVVILDVEGLPQLLGLTADHEVLRVQEDGTEDWVEAQDLQPGDLLTEAQVLQGTRGYPEQIDLAEWWRDRTLQAKRRCRENRAGFEVEDREISVTEALVDEDGELSVSFRYEQDDAGRIAAAQKTQKLIDWLCCLPSPTVATYRAVGVLVGLSKSEVANAVVRLQDRLPGFKIDREYRTTWHPLLKGTKSPDSHTCRVETSSVTKIAVTEDFCYLLGTWLGDGDVWTSKEVLLNVHSFGWTFGKDKVAQEIKAKVLESIGGAFGDLPVSEHPYGKKQQDVDYFCFTDPLLGRWLMEEFGHTAAGKRLPEWVFDLPDGQLLALLRGFLDTDGGLTVDRKTEIDFQLDNPLLLDQIHLLCNRLGFHTGRKQIHRKAYSWTRQWKTKKGMREKTYHYEPKTFERLTCSRSRDVERWAREGSVKGSRKTWPERNHVWGSKFIAGRLTRKVKKVKKVFYEGPVYSFAVQEDESHTANFLNVHNCLRVLVYRDKLRQAQTSIASRHMTPFRLIYAEDMDEAQVDELREQVDYALMDPDYSIITNFQVNWEELGGGAGQRLLDLSTEYDLTDRQMYAGLGVTESLLSGESTYSGDRLHLEVINTRYMLLRELLKSYVEKALIKPMCRRMGFIEEDEDGYEVVIHPRLSFTRLAIRDNSETFDAMFNLYTKGSLPIDLIYDLLNIDPVTANLKLEEDLFTLKDATFNEVLRSVYSRAGDSLAENSNVTEVIAENLSLKYKKPEEEGGRF